ncbi:MAG: M14 family metallopeptidase [Bacteroidota bacterium]
MITRLAILFILLCAATIQLQAQPVQLLTRAEQTNYEETSRHADVVAFVDAVSASSPLLHNTTFGYSFEGRALPLVVVGEVPDASAEAVLSSGKTRVFIQANIHAGEVCGKEAMQMMLRDIAGGAHAAWLDSLVLLIAPIYNADGNERVKLTNRGRQHGPVAGMGQRPNAQGYDLNRDHMKLDSPEARSLVNLFNTYDPHVVIDLHTTNGTRHGYHLTYAQPLHPNTDSRIDDFLRNAWLPAAGQYLKKTTGWESQYYGNARRHSASSSEDTAEQAWHTFDHRPRFNNNYTGLRNRFAILSEAYSYATFEDRVIATLRFVEGTVEFAAAHATQIQEIVDAVDNTALAGSTLALRASRQQTGEIQILMGEVDEVRNPYSGEIMLERKNVLNPVTMADFSTFAPADMESVPIAYYIDATAKDVLHKLADHGVKMAQLDQDMTLEMETFRIDSTTVASREFQQHFQRTLYGDYEKEKATLPAGTYVVQTNQPLGRLIFSLLEPRSDDGLLNWNVLDDAVKKDGKYPIRRSMP